MASRLRDRNRYAGEGFLLPSANLEGHWDASRSDTITIATGVSNWADLSGNGRDLLQATGADQPSYANNGVTTDGISQFVKTAPFTFNQPEAVYLVMRQVAHGGTFADGNTNNSMRVFAAGSSPDFFINAGASIGANSDLAVGSDGVIAAVFNGASSSSKVSHNAAVTGDAGAANAGAFTIGDKGGGSDFSNITVYEVALYSVAHNAATQTAIITGLMNKWGIP